MATVNAFTTFLAPQLRNGRRFRFVYLSGLPVERDQTKTLWFGRDLRRFKVCRSLQHGAANADLRTLGQAMLLEEAGRQHIEN
jgi:hypothetical protein